MKFLLVVVCCCLVTLTDRGVHSEAHATTKKVTNGKPSSHKSVKTPAGNFLFSLAELQGSKISAARLVAKKWSKRFSPARLQSAVKRGRLIVRPRLSRLKKQRVMYLRVRSTRPSPPCSYEEPTADENGGSNGTGPDGSTDSPACPDLIVGSFQAGVWPDGCWRPYADSSPFNHKLPANARVAANSEKVVGRLLGFGAVQGLDAGTAGSEDDWSAPWYYSKDSDPLFTVHCMEDWGRCEVEGMQVRIPDRARAAAGGDGHLVVFDQRTGWEYDFWQVRNKPAGGGQLDISWGGRTRIDGDGLDSNATAAMFGRMGGIIRAAELERGRIDHALYMVAYCDSGEFVYPAMKTGRACDWIGKSNTNAPAMGSRFQLDMTPAAIDALEVPAWKKTILRAMAEYGLYLGDTGSGSWAIQAESGASYTSFGYEDPLVSFAKKQQLSSWQGRYLFNIHNGVDWRKHLKLVDVCVTWKTC